MVSSGKLYFRNSAYISQYINDPQLQNKDFMASL